MSGGRPSLFTPELGLLICERLMDGLSLRKISKLPNMPAVVTVIRWLGQGDIYISQGVEHPLAEFRKQYAYAREAQADVYAEDCVDIADESTFDLTTDEDGKEIVNINHIQRDRLRIDARKWYASKLAPKKYGEKTQTELSGPDGAPLNVSLIDYSTIAKKP